MLLLGIFLVLPLLQAYPMNSQGTFKDEPSAPLSDPADYPDLTNGLTDAEVQETLQDLSLDDLNSLEKLLDEHSNHDEDAESDASLRGQNRQANAKIDSGLKNSGFAMEDGCPEDDECDDLKPITKRPSCRTSASKQCSKTRTTNRPSPKTTRQCKADDDDGTTKCPKSKVQKSKKDDLDCESDDYQCLARKKSRLKEITKKYKKEEDSLDAPGEYVPARELAGIEQLGDEILPPLNNQGEPLDEVLNSEFSNEAQLKDDSEQLARQANFEMEYQAHLEDEHQLDLDHEQPRMESDRQENLQLSPDQANLEFGNQEKMEQEHLVNLEMENMASLEQERQVGLSQGEQPLSQPQNSKQAESNEPFAEKPAAVNTDYERHQLSRSYRNKKQAEEEKPMVEQSPPVEDAQKGIPIEESPGKLEAALDGDSFISSNARDPPRYVIQMQNGYIQSDNDPGQLRLREDRSQSEALNVEKLAVKEESPFENSNSKNEYKRNKREDKGADNDDENPKETYLKDLMDSFPRDQGGQINANVALRNAHLAHLRIKRS